MGFFLVALTNTLSALHDASSALEARDRTTFFAETFALLFILCSTSALASNHKEDVSSDPCLAQLLPHESLLYALATVLKSEFPSFRPPLSFDNLEEDIAYNKSQGGNGCLGVASGDFDGNGEKDFVIGLTPFDDGIPNVVIALSRKGKWTFKKIDSWADKRSRLYVDAVPPGRFRRTEALNGPLSAGERHSLTCPHDGVLVGTIESTGIVYCHIGNDWPYVWVSD